MRARQRQVDESTDVAVRLRIQPRLLVNTRCRSTDVEGTHGELRSGFADGLRGDDAGSFAHFNGATWSVQVVDSRYKTGYYPALQFGGSDRPTISYYSKTGGDLRVAIATTSGWACTLQLSCTTSILLALG